MRFERWLLAIAFASTGAIAQVLPADPDWKEVEAPRPPALRTTGLIMLEVRGSSLQFGVDPESFSIGPDAIVRYVLVARNDSGALNALYEGIRCNSGDVKVYARHDPDKGWVPAPGAEWVPLQRGRHERTSLQVARQGACMGHSPNGSARQIVEDLRAPVNRRFGAR
ncbi:hypothetical protein FN976_20970 [Caenimonas sedimenti]|uniref:CNP1-like uncharacterized domain-containing protein n=1 Tax=Caenimonas sedimenti TaxID=2596921 RepID=A0A562ZJV7_9BURK|nr:CNP1-like family protein [Caenimonas sedimenti]TWO68872.1 hypothetical protein FN976_20970 [Caenimonas sedimenti]